MKTLLMPIFLILMSCSATKIVSTWHDPNKKIKISTLKKVLVLAKFKTETSNRQAEDNLVKYLNGSGVQSYVYLKPTFNKDNIEGIRTKIKNDDFDGVINMRLIDVDQEKVLQRDLSSRYPGSERDFNNHFYESQMAFNNADYYVTTKVYLIETNVYSIKDNKIIWTALTETTDPTGVEKMAKEIAKTVYKQMVTDSFIK